MDSDNQTNGVVSIMLVLFGLMLEKSTIISNKIGSFQFMTKRRMYNDN